MSRNNNQTSNTALEGADQDFIRRIEDWRFKGYNVQRLEKVKDEAPSVRREALAKFEKDVRELEEIDQVIQMMKQQGLSKYVRDLEPLLKDPDKLSIIARRLIELDGVIETMTDNADLTKTAPNHSSQSSAASTAARSEPMNEEEMEEWEVEFEISPMADAHKEEPEREPAPKKRETPQHAEKGPTAMVPKEALMEGKTAYSQGRYEDALDCFERVLADEPNNLEARFFRSRTQKRIRSEQTPHHPSPVKRQERDERRTVRLTQPVGTKTNDGNAPPSGAETRATSSSFQPPKGEIQWETTPPNDEDMGPQKTPLPGRNTKEMEQWFQEYEEHKQELAKLKQRKEKEYQEQQKTEELENRIDVLKGKGFDATRLERRIDEGFQSLKSEFNTLTDHVEQLIELSQRLDALADAGHNQAVEEIKSTLFDVKHLDQLHVAVEELEEKATYTEEGAPTTTAPTTAPATKTTTTTTTTTAKATRPGNSGERTSKATAPPELREHARSVAELAHTPKRPDPSRRGAATGSVANRGGREEDHARRGDEEPFTIDQNPYEQRPPTPQYPKQPQYSPPSPTSTTPPPSHSDRRPPSPEPVPEPESEPKPEQEAAGENDEILQLRREIADLEEDLRRMETEREGLPAHPYDAEPRPDTPARSTQPPTVRAERYPYRPPPERDDRTGPEPSTEPARKPPRKPPRERQNAPWGYEDHPPPQRRTRERERERDHTGSRPRPHEYRSPSPQTRPKHTPPHRYGPFEDEGYPPRPRAQESPPTGREEQRQTHTTAQERGARGGAGTTTGGVCERCHGSGICTLCRGSGQCAWCGGTGYGERQNEEGKCYYCNGLGYCLWCNGTGRCEKCSGSGRSRPSN